MGTTNKNIPPLENSRGNSLSKSSIEIERELVDKERALREKIREYEKLGININRAWALLVRARTMTKDDEQALDWIARADADLEIKKQMHRWSSGKRMVLTCLAIIVAIAIFPAAYFICQHICGKEFLTILNVPWFIIVWGYIGSATYIVLTIINRITAKTLDPHRFPEYFFRLLLGGIFAGIIFYVLQLSFFSLPINKDSAYNFEDDLNRVTFNKTYETVYKEYQDNKFELQSFYGVITEFKDYKDSNPLDKATIMSRNENKINDAYDYLSESYGASDQSPPINFGEIKKFITSPEVQQDTNYINKINTYYANALSILENKHSSLEKIFQESETAEKETPILVEKIGLDKKIRITNDKIDELNSHIDNNMYQEGLYKAEQPSSPKSESMIKNCEKLINEDKVELSSLKLELATYDKAYEDAVRKEHSRPIWESAFFLVSAFLSGFSVSFVNHLMNRAIKGILGGVKTEEFPSEEEKPDTGPN